MVDYTSLLERELSLGNIPTGVVDAHHHALPFWFHFLQGQKAHLLHIDAHSDMGIADKVKRKPRNEQEVVEQTFADLTITDFIWAADYMDMLSTIFWDDPRRDQIVVYKDDIRENYPRAGKGIHGNCWHYGDPDQPILTTHRPTQKRTKIKSRINNDSLPIILDIDLDAFLCYRAPNERQLPDEVWHQRIAETLGFLSGLRKPSVITLARSLHPVMYTPIGKVGAIEARLIRGLETIYGPETPVYPTESDGPQIRLFA